MNQLDAHYVGRAVRIIHEGMADAVQVCVTPSGFDLDVFRQNSLRRAQMIADAVLSQPFKEDLLPNAITGPICCGECD